MWQYMCFALLSNCPTFSFPCCAHESVLYVSVYYCLANHHYHFSIFHIFVLIYNIHFSPSDLFHFVEQALTLLRMAIIKKQYMLERM